MAFEDLTGKTFGRWTVLSQSETRISPNGDSYRYWLCRCKCGVERPVKEMSLKQGRSKSCGCYHSDLMRDVGKVNTTHGMSETRLYRIYKHMLCRCYNEHDIRYPHYGGRGITVCEEWKSFEPFMEWAYKTGYNNNLSIDRIDVDKGYSPDNCKWSTVDEQANNKTNNVLVEYDGRTQNVAEWAREFDMPYKKLWKRIHAGWTPERALTA